MADVIANRMYVTIYTLDEYKFTTLFTMVQPNRDVLLDCQEIILQKPRYP